MFIRRAEVKDVDKLVEIRQDFQQLMKGTRGGPDFVRAVKDYLTEGIADGTAVVWLAQEKERIVSCAHALLCQGDAGSGEPERKNRVYTQCIYPFGTSRAGAGGAVGKKLPALGKGVGSRAGAAWRFGAGQTSVRKAGILADAG